MSRTGWVCIQSLVGVLNAYFMIANLYDGKYFGAAISAAGVVFMAKFRLPPKSTKK